MKRKKHKHRWRSWMTVSGVPTRMCNCGLVEDGDWHLATGLYEYCTLGNKVMAVRISGSIFVPIKTYFEKLGEK